MAARKIDGWWYADFYVRGERYRERSPQNSAPAARVYEEFLREEIAKKGSLKHLEPQKPEEEKQEVPTFAELAERWMTEYMSLNYRWSEQRNRRNILCGGLIPVFGKFQLNQITSQHVEDYKNRLLRKGLSKKTVNNNLTILRKCLATAVEWELLDEVPSFKILRIRGLPPFTYLRPDETPQLLSALPAGLWRTMALVAVRTGLRYSELIALRWEDVDFETRMICVQRAEVDGHVGPPKSERIRHVPMNGEVMDALRNYSPGRHRVFSLRGKSVPYLHALRVLNRGCRDAGVRMVSWHDLRHTFASDLTRCGVSLHAIKDLLGHETIEMTLRYAHLGNETLHEAVARIEKGPIRGQYTGSGTFFLATNREEDQRHHEKHRSVSDVFDGVANRIRTGDNGTTTRLAELQNAAR